MTQLNAEQTKETGFISTSLVGPSNYAEYFEYKSGGALTILKDLTPESLNEAAKELRQVLQAAEISVDITIKDLLWNDWSGRAYTALHIFSQKNSRIEYSWKSAEDDKDDIFCHTNTYSYFPNQFLYLVRTRNRNENGNMPSNIKPLIKNITLDDMLNLILSYGRHYSVKEVVIPEVKFYISPQKKKKKKPN